MLLAKSENNVLTYLHTDHLGSVVLETNAAGAVVNDQRYYAYGRRLDVSGDTSGEKDFTGQRRDATGLVYMNCILPLQHRHRVPKASGACRNSVSVLDRTCQSKSMGPAQASPMPASALYLLIAGR